MPGRRVHERFACELPVTVLAGDREIETTASNVSLGGMYLLTDERLEYGTEVKVRFRVPALKEDAEPRATVRWQRNDGFGVQFGSLRAIEVWALNQFFKSLESQPES